MEQFANIASTTLNGTISAGATSLVVTSATAFPASGNFRIIVETEIMLVTAVAGTTFTVTRGQESTAAVSHNSGVLVTHTLTAGALTQLKSDLLPVSTYASRPAAGVASRIFSPTDGGFQFVDDGTTWRPIIDGIVGTQPPSAASFTAFNQGSATLVDANGTVFMSGANDGGGNVIRGFTQPFTNGVNTICEAVVLMQPDPSQSGSTWSAHGVIIRESSSARAVTMWLAIAHTNSQFYGESTTWTSNTSRTGAVGYAYGGPGPMFIRLRKDATNFYSEYSRNRVSWVLLDTRTIASIGFSSGPDSAGLVTMGINVVPRMVVPHFNIV